MNIRIPLAILVIILLSAACSDDEPETTKPRPPRPPYYLLTQPDSVYVQLMIAMEFKSAAAYINAFAESFEFNPDPQDARALIDETENPSLFDNWDHAVEEAVHASIFDSYSSMELTFTGAAMDSAGQEDQIVLLRKPYQLTADGRLFEGGADLTMIRHQGEWRIIIWVDHRWTHENPSWTVLRGEHR